MANSQDLSRPGFHDTYVMLMLQLLLLSVSFGLDCDATGAVAIDPGHGLGRPW